MNKFDSEYFGKSDEQGYLAPLKAGSVPVLPEVREATKTFGDGAGALKSRVKVEYIIWRQKFGMATFRNERSLDAIGQHNAEDPHKWASDREIPATTSLDRGAGP